MSFFNTIKCALGFDSDDDEPEVGIDATVQPLHSVPDEAAPTMQPLQEAPEAVERREIPVDVIFSRVVEIFNEALPDFLKKSVDPEAERRLLYDALDTSVKEYLTSLAEEAERESAERWKKEKTRLYSEFETLRSKATKAEENENESKTRRLSAERQKRALNERIHDLESQIAQLQAEHEQFELENKSLINKLRVNSIQEGDNEVLRQEIADLKARIASGAPSEPEDYQETKEKLAAAETGCTALKEQVDEISRQLEDTAARLAESQRKAEEAERSREEAENRVAEIEQKLNSASEELAETQRTLAIAEEIQAQVERFEEIKNRKDAKITDLQAKRDQMVERVRMLENECRSLKKTIESNLMSQARSESEFKSEIERLRKMLSESPDQSPVTPEPMPTVESKPRQRRKKSQVKISAIDESLDNTDWLVATPPEGTSLRNSVTSDSDNQFGYQAPHRKTPPDNEAQMSLW